MKRMLTIFCVLSLIFVMVGCGGNDNEGDNIDAPSVDEKTPEQSPEQNPEEIVPDSNITAKIGYVDIEVGETYNISSLLSEYNGMEVLFEDDTLISYDDGVITGVKSGVCKIILKHRGKEQVVRLEVHEDGELDTIFTFDEYRLAGKKIVAFGDSGTANSTVNGADTYYNLFAKHYNMVEGGNFAIGGTTATYGFARSNIDKEYHGTTFYGGPQRILEVYKQGLLDDVDYVILSYVGNDRYFQTPIIDENEPAYDVDVKTASVTDPDVYKSAHSFKGSYRHMIKTLRQINPNVRIIISNYHYSEFDLYTYAAYGSQYHVEEYRKAEREIAEEMNVKYINPWQHTRNYWDYGLNATGPRQYYKDCVHLTTFGHEKMVDYWINGGAEWYIVGSMNNWVNDIDWQFARFGNKSTFSIRLQEGQTFKIQSTDGSVVLDGTNSAISSIEGLENENGNIKVTESGIYTFVIRKSDSKLTIKKEIPVLGTIFTDTAGTTIKAIEINENTGQYIFQRTFVLWSGITLFYDGEHLTPENTTFEGKFNNVSSADWSDNLYRDDTALFRYVSSYNGSVTLKFVYEPSLNKLSITLA